MAANRPTIAAATAALLSLALAACGSSPSSPGSASARIGSSSAGAKAANPPLAGKVKVAIGDYAYHPATITVKVGTKVTFTNHDHTPHTATSTSPVFDTGTLRPRHSATVVLTKPGTYAYYCQFHAFMRATIIVN